jgi:predicted nucleotidyltransferase
MRIQDIVKKTTAYHDELCPAAWLNGTLRGEVRERLIGIAQLFISYLEVNGFEVKDIVLTGSLANYNWTEFSDFDLHVVTDYRNLECDDLAEAFYRAKKTIWNERHDITIYAHEVELYVEDVNEPPVSGGVYSVLHDHWIKEPRQENPNINDTAIVHKVQDLVDQIERNIASADDPEDLRRLTDKISKMRKNGLADGGEFSVENLTFKTLRNLGIIKALHDAYAERQDAVMSLNEMALAEIDFANVLTQLSTDKKDILTNAKPDGKLNGRPVFLYVDHNTRLFFFANKNEIEAMILLSGNELKAIKNFTGQKGYVFALLNYIAVKKGIKLTIGADEPLTLDGLKWVLNLITNRTKLKVTDLHGNAVDPMKLKQEWLQAQSTNIPVPTGLIISEAYASWKQKLEENDNSLMPYAFFDFKKTL